MGVAAAVVPAVAGLFGSVASAAASSSSVSRANDANLNIAQMNNHFQEKMMEKQQGYNVENWNRQKDFAQSMFDQSIENQWNIADYNSPVNARQRYEEAGFNPYMMLGNIGSGNVSSSASTQSAGAAGSVGMPTGNTPTMLPNRFDFSDIGHSISTGIQLYNDLKNSDVNRRNVAADAHSKEIDNQTRYLENMERIWNLRENTKSTKLRNAYQEVLNDNIREMQEIDKITGWQNISNMKETFKGIQLQNAIDQIHLDNLPQQYRLSFASLVAETTYKYALTATERSRKKLTDWQIEHEVDKIFETYQRREGIRLDNEIKKKTKEYIVEQAKWQQRIAANQAWNTRHPDSPFNILNGIQDIYGDYIPMDYQGWMWTPRQNWSK